MAAMHRRGARHQDVVCGVDGSGEHQQDDSKSASAASDHDLSPPGQAPAYLSIAIRPRKCWDMASMWGGQNAQFNEFISAYRFNGRCGDRRQYRRARRRRPTKAVTTRGARPPPSHFVSEAPPWVFSFTRSDPVSAKFSKILDFNAFVIIKTQKGVIFKFF